MGEEPLSDANVYLAAERTFLAWIRTGLALIGFGFVVARFGLFLLELEISQPLQPQSYGLSPWFGAALIMLGVIANLWSLWRHVRLVQAWRRGEVAFRRPSSLTTVVALLLAAIGLAMAIYLASTHAPNHANREGLPERAMTPNPDHGIVRNTSQHAVDDTVTTLERILQAKGGKPSGAWHWQRTSSWSSTAGTATLTPWPRRSRLARARRATSR